MATIKFKDGSEYMAKLEKLERSTREKVIAPAIYNAADIVANEIRDQLRKVPTDERWGTNSNPLNGPNKQQKKGLYDSLGIASLQDDGGFLNVKIGFDGYNKIKTKRWPQGQPNQMVARSVERGTSFMQGNPFVKRAVSRAKNEALSEMQKFGMTRADCVVAVGGGVVGDLAGFVSASYMRGIDFYNIPTTLLSQVDSSIGGKTALNLGGVKNIVGAFYQPKGVLIDVDTLKTLPERQFKNGLCEVVKMAATCDEKLFEFIENSDFSGEDIEKIIVGALKIKKSVVESDEREAGLRRVLNFGHTLGHAIEVNSDYYHGECVGIGMIPFSASGARDRIKALLTKIGLPTEYKDVNSLLKRMKMDKKAEGDEIFCVFVEKIGSFEIKKITFDELEKIIEEGYEK